MSKLLKMFRQSYKKKIGKNQETTISSRCRISKINLQTEENVISKKQVKKDEELHVFYFSLIWSFRELGRTFCPGFCHVGIRIEVGKGLVSVTNSRKGVKNTENCLL